MSCHRKFYTDFVLVGRCWFLAKKALKTCDHHGALLLFDCLLSCVIASLLLTFGFAVKINKMHKPTALYNTQQKTPAVTPTYFYKEY